MALFRILREKETIIGWSLKGQPITDEIYGMKYECSECGNSCLDQNFSHCPYCGERITIKED